MDDRTNGARQVSVAEAAALLGASVDTIKRRVRSGALQGSRDAPQPAPHLQGNEADLAALHERVAAISAERDWLRERVERAESEREQLRILLSNAQQSLVRALQAAPQDAPHSPVAGQQTAEGSPTRKEPSTPIQAPWWRRWLAAVSGWREEGPMPSLITPDVAILLILFVIGVVLFKA